MLSIINETIVSLATAFNEALSAFLAATESGLTPTYSPSDFPLAEVDEEDLANLANLLQDIDNE